MESSTPARPDLQRAINVARRGRTAEATALCQGILASAPGDFDALHLLGVLTAQQGDTKAALGWLDQAAHIRPDHLGLLINLGGLLRLEGRLSEALECFDRAVSVHPDHPMVLGNRGILLAELGRLEESLDCIDRVVRLRPGDPDAMVNRGIALMRLGRWAEALADYDEAVAIRPDHAVTRIVRAAALLKLRRPAESLADCDRVLALDPENATALADRGTALMALCCPAEALASYDAGLLVFPDDPHLLDHRANALRLFGYPIEALAGHERAALLAPDDPTVRRHLGMCRMLLGDFSGGLPLYEARWQCEPLNRAKRPFAGPPWLGRQSLRGKSILLHAEQGLGDTIQFCRYAELVAQQGATVSLEVQPALKSLLTGLKGVDRLLVRGEALPRFDYHCPLMSLPLACGTDLDTIPAKQRYITADPARVARWSKRFPMAGRPRIGLTWSGNPNQAKDRDRSMPFACLARLINGSAHFFGLQTEVRPSDLSVLAARNDIEMADPASRDFADTAALIELMDLVVTVDTSVAHLAGAMGKPVWILLALDPDWRWLLGRDDCPFYPSATLFRQTAYGDWDSVVDSVAARLAGGI